MQVIAVVLFIFVNILGINAGTNFDATWTFSCPAGQSIYRIKSVHSNHHEDRSWSFYCRSNSKISRSCSWSSYVNWFDRKISYRCHDGVISGVHSYHSNHHEDRRFKFRCCRFKGCLKNCFWTSYVNYWDAYMNYAISYGYFLVGANSVHHNGREDRRWKFYICKG